MSDTAGSLSNTAGSRNASGADGGFDAGLDAGFQDGAAVDRLLIDAGMDDDGGLRTALLELRSLSAGQPVPSAAVASLMVPAEGAPRVLAAVPMVARTAAMSTIAAPTVPAETAAAPAAAAVTADAPAAVPVDELAARRRAKRRITLTTLSVAVSLAAGGAVAVASDQGIRDTIGALNHAVTSFVSGTGGADKAGQTPSTGPTQPGGTATVPAPGAPANSGPGAAPATSPEPGSANGGAGSPATATPGTVPPSGITVPDNLAPGNLTPGMPGADAPGAGTPGDGAPLNGGPLDEVAPGLPGQQPLLPLPVTPPASPAPGP